MASRLLADSTTRLRKTHGHDAAGRLTTVTYNDGTTYPVTITYDRLSRPDIQSNGIATTNYDFDPVSFALDKETIIYNLPDKPEFTRIIDHKQDDIQRSSGLELKTSSLLTEFFTNYGYSSSYGRLGSVSSQTLGDPNTSDFIYGYESDSNLHKTTQSFINYDFDTSTGTAIHQSTRKYEATRDVLESITNTNSAASVTISANDYAVNAIGQREAVARTGSGLATPTSANANFTYNERGELVTANEATDTMDRAYEYDGIGNREKSANSLTLPSAKNYTVNELNQYTAFNSFTPTYDDDGNQINAQIIGSTGLQSAAFQWDAENRLTEVKNSSNATVVKYYYDSQFRKIATIADGNTTLFVYDTWNCIAEYQYQSSQFALRSTYTWGQDLSGEMQGVGGVGGLLAVTELPLSGSSVTYFPLYDGNGNIIQYVDVNCNVVAHYEYDPFGSCNVATGTKAESFSYRFSTKPLDPSTGLYYYGYRWYDVKMGRWISRDVIGENGGLNLYGFVSNNGLNSIDYLGLKNPLDEDWEWGYCLCQIFSGAAHAFGSEIMDQISSLDPRNLSEAVKGIKELAGAISRGEIGIQDIIQAGFPNLTGLITHIQYHGFDGLNEKDFCWHIGQASIDIAKIVSMVAGGGGAVAILSKIKKISKLGKGLPDAPKIPDAPNGPDAPPIPGACFVAGTEIETQAGGKAIELLRVGDRVLTSDGNSTTKIDPTAWRKISLKMPNPEYPSDIIEVELLRSEDWIVRTGCNEGARMWFELEEMGLKGWAHVQSISDCPEIKAGSGRVILATVTHYNTFVMELRLEGHTEPLRPTDRHRLFSATRNDWIPTALLKTGEELNSADGKVRIAAIRKLPGTHRVYNIEVETEHSYFAGKAKVLSHNVNPCMHNAPGSGQPFVPDEYWTRNAPDNVTPGTKRIDHTKYNEKTGEYEQSRVTYDEYGRQNYRVDKTDHGRPSGNGHPNDTGHTNPHLHESTYAPEGARGHNQATGRKEVKHNLK